MWKKWFPWRWIVRKVAQKQGFLDPIAFISKLQRFAQPSEVAAPVELIRLATVLQARGLLNVQAIQHNLDWIWPYWVERQFDPRDPSFIPRAFSLTHINLTHRNWTAVGIPDFQEYPLVDPRGLLTPFYDSESVDVWIIHEEGDDLLPSRAGTALQHWEREANPCLRTQIQESGCSLVSRVSVEQIAEQYFCILKAGAFSERAGWIAVAVRPFNPEGVSEIQHIGRLEGDFGLEIEKKHRFYFNESPEAYYFSEYQEGDVYRKLANIRSGLKNQSSVREVNCKAGMATAVALFRLDPGKFRQIEIRIPLQEKKTESQKSFMGVPEPQGTFIWQKTLKGHCRLQVADKKTAYLYETALHTLVLLSPETEVFPGPYTYKYFWFRDASFILQALLALNLPGRVKKILDYFPKRQNANGHFRSQDGEWDSNGQALWIFRRFCELTQTLPEKSWEEAIRKGAEWILKKRVSENQESLHAGLFPAGFSAEHLGPNDFYYWDDFWGVEGLRSAAWLMKFYGHEAVAQKYQAAADEFLKAIEKSLSRVANRIQTTAMPSSPYRRMDTSAIGSVTVGYPLNFWPPDDPRVMCTVEYLLGDHFINGGFYHEMSHSGINPYMTLSLAQILLRNEDGRYAELLRSMQSMATQSGQWPEAIHPQVLGGCMGDGQHAWAAAEWVMMIKNCFLREEEGRLILCSGVLPEWYAEDSEASLGRMLTPYGTVSVSVKREATGVWVRWEAEWAPKVPRMEVRLPGYRAVEVQKNETSVILTKEKKI